MKKILKNLKQLQHQLKRKQQNIGAMKEEVTILQGMERMNMDITIAIKMH